MHARLNKFWQVIDDVRGRTLERFLNLNITEQRERICACISITLPKALCERPTIQVGSIFDINVKTVISAHLMR